MLMSIAGHILCQHNPTLPNISHNRNSFTPKLTTFNNTRFWHQQKESWSPVVTRFTTLSRGTICPLFRQPRVPPLSPPKNANIDNCHILPQNLRAYMLTPIKIKHTTRIFKACPNVAGTSVSTKLQAAFEAGLDGVSFIC